MTTIELVRAPWWRTAARWTHLGSAALVAVAVFAQVYLIGAYIFGAGQDVLEAHRSVGFSTHLVECLVFIAALVAWLPRTDILLSLALAAIGTAQIALASAHGWTGGLHPLFALVVLALAAQIVRRGLPDKRPATD
jgi:glucose-6-phosphate-specific signal transduction histidine kinase